MLSGTKGKRRDGYLPDYVVYDLETTGTSCKMDRIVEISAVRVQGGRAVDEFTSLVNPGCSIPAAASRVNHITDGMVANMPMIQEVLPEFLDFSGELPFVGHNIHTFDMKFLYRDCEQYFGGVPGNDYVDTLIVARMCLPALKHHRLVDLAEYYGIPSEGAHRALNDCRINQRVYECLSRELKNVGQNSGSFKLCPRCGQPLLKRNGKFGMFWGCSGFPSCRYTQNM